MHLVAFNANPLMCFMKTSNFWDAETGMILTHPGTVGVTFYGHKFTLCCQLCGRIIRKYFDHITGNIVKFMPIRYGLYCPRNKSKIILDFCVPKLNVFMKHMREMALNLRCMVRISSS